MTRIPILSVFLGLSLLVHAGIFWTTEYFAGAAEKSIKAVTPVLVELLSVEKNTGDNNTDQKPKERPLKRELFEKKKQQIPDQICITECDDRTSDVSKSSDEVVDRAIDATSEKIATDNDEHSETVLNADRKVALKGDEEAVCWAGIAETLNARASGFRRQRRRHGGNGRVVLRFSVDVDRRARDIEIESTSGNALLDEAAVELLKDTLPYACKGRGRWAVRFVEKR